MSLFAWMLPVALVFVVGVGAGSASEADAVREIGVVDRPPDHLGRDVGFSARLNHRSVWIFGDTFLPRQAADGLSWRSSSWSWTRDTDSSDGIGPFTHALDEDGLALQLLPHTSAEADYNRSHEGHDACDAGADCGKRRTPWPQALVADPSGQRAVIYYLNMQTGSENEWDFRSVSGSIAIWDDADYPARRVEPPLFSNEEPDWGAAALLVDGDIHVYACEFDGVEKPCLLARVPFEQAAERASYHFWAGDAGWSEDWREAVAIFSGGSLFSVYFDTRWQRYMAYYMPGIDNAIYARSAPSPQGPWSEAQRVGEGIPAAQNWNYALIAHPEFLRDDGRVEVFSYTRPSGFLEQEIRLLEIRTR